MFLLTEAAIRSAGVAPNTVLDPGQSAVLSVSFDPKTTGSLPGTVTIFSNAPNPQMKIASLR